MSIFDVGNTPLGLYGAVAVAMLAAAPIPIGKWLPMVNVFIGISDPIGAVEVAISAGAFALVAVWAAVAVRAAALAQPSALLVLFAASALGVDGIETVAARAAVLA